MKNKIVYDKTHYPSRKHLPFDCVDEMLGIIDFFDEPLVLNTEKESLFGSQIQQTFKLTSAVDDEVSENKHDNLNIGFDPFSFCPVKDLHPNAKINCHTFLFDDILARKEIYFFGLVKNSEAKKSERSWFLFYDKYFAVYDVGNGIRFFPTLEKPQVKGRHLLINGDRIEKYNVKVSKSITNYNDNEKSAIAHITKALAHEYPSGPDAFIECYNIIRESPPVCNETLNFYRSSIENPIFLLKIAQIDSYNLFTRDFAMAWFNAAKDYLPTLLRVLFYDEYLKIVNFRQCLTRNSFIKFLLETLLRDDTEFMRFCDTITFDKSPVQDLIVAFEKVDVLPNTRFMLFHAANEASRRFPGSWAHYFALSNVLFNTVFLSVVKVSEEILGTLSNLFILNDKVIKLQQVWNFQSLLDSYCRYPNGYVLRVSDHISISDVNVISNFLTENVALVASLFPRYDVYRLVKDYSDKFGNLEQVIKQPSPTRTVDDDYAKQSREQGANLNLFGEVVVEEPQHMEIPSLQGNFSQLPFDDVVSPKQEPNLPSPPSHFGDETAQPESILKESHPVADDAYMEIGEKSPEMKEKPKAPQKKAMNIHHPNPYDEELSNPAQITPKIDKKNAKRKINYDESDSLHGTRPINENMFLGSSQTDETPFTFDEPVRKSIDGKYSNRYDQPDSDENTDNRYNIEIESSSQSAIILTNTNDSRPPTLQNVPGIHSKDFLDFELGGGSVNPIKFVINKNNGNNGDNGSVDDDAAKIVQDSVLPPPPKFDISAEDKEKLVFEDPDNEGVTNQ